MAGPRDRINSPPSEIVMLMAFETIHPQGSLWTEGLQRFCRLRAQYGYDISLPGAEKSAARVVNKGQLLKFRGRGELTPAGREALELFRAALLGGGIERRARRA